MFRRTPSLVDVPVRWPDPDVAVVLLTGAGRAFSAGNDLKEMEARITDPQMSDQGSHFTTMISALTDLTKPLVCAVNGVGVGIGTTVLGYADLVFMSSTARLKCPFTSLGVAPEAASSYLLPQLIGRQNAAWMLLSSQFLMTNSLPSHCSVLKQAYMSWSKNPWP